MDAVVAPLTDHAQIQLREGQIGGLADFDDVMHDETLLGEATYRAPVSGFDDEITAQSMPCRLGQIGPGILDSPSPIRMFDPADGRQIGGIAPSGAESARVGLGIEHRAARFAYALGSLPAFRSRTAPRCTPAFRATCPPQYVIGPAEEGGPAVDTFHDNAVAWWFGHAQSYHVQDDKALIQDSVMAAAIAASQTSDEGWFSV